MADGTWTTDQEQKPNDGWLRNPLWEEPKPRPPKPERPPVSPEIKKKLKEQL